MNKQSSNPDQAEEALAMYPEIQEMFDEFPRFRPEILPSKYWEELNRKNLQQLVESRYENFKRTVARNYFTWIVNPFNKQIRFLMSQAGPWQSIRYLMKALFAPRHDYFKKRHTIHYNLLTKLLWEYVEKHDDENLLDKLIEPAEGNPLDVRQNGRLISQDLANSVLEYKAILHREVDRRDVKTVLELGPGYGRTAYIFLALQPDCRYILVDIPPALYLAQRYLTAVFPDRRVFPFRPIESFENVADEFNNSSIIFLTPNQLELLPDNATDLFINISSLHEMRMDQIRYYFSEVERLTRRYFYFKQWKETTVPFENNTVREADYPVGEHWQLINRQQCEVQHKFFEALYKLPDPDHDGLAEAS
ncbi:MAG: putative sugar O-methyltransferase [Woeseiaceae bacterium]|nr:putative sugar O-methyltransferase [Woeseiaceae bacterium]